MARIHRIDDASVRASRKRIERSARLLPPLPRGSSYEPVSAGGVPAVWVCAPGVAAPGTAAGPTPGALLYLHGGAYAAGSPRAYRDLCVRLSAALGLPALVLDYRLAPECPVPAALHDAQAAWHWLLASGVRPSGSVFAGDSAGGGLALALALLLRHEQMPLPACALLMSPWTDLSASGDSIRANADSDAYLSPQQLEPVARAYLAGADPRDPLASPLFGELGGMPPLCIHYSEYELLADDSRRLAARAGEAGVDVSLTGWPGLPHAFQIFAPMLPEARASLRAMAAFARATIDR
ncbi:MAG: alpha/beta hydrolase [Gammaproteobacteria bacterium]